MPSLPDLISEAQTTEERFLRQIFVRDQMAEWSKRPLVMAKAEGVHYWDVEGKRYLDGLSGIYVASLGHNNRRVIEAIKKQLDTLCFSPPMHGTNPVAVQLAIYPVLFRAVRELSKRGVVKELTPDEPAINVVRFRAARVLNSG